MKQPDIFGDEHDVDLTPDNAPTEAWIKGWGNYMDDGLGGNPYPVDDYRHNEWQDGYDAAERD